MLTLADTLRLGRFTVYRDVDAASAAGGQRRYTPRFYVLPDAPRVALDADGAPLFDFVWYRPPADEPQPGRAGGMVTLTVELGPTATERDEIVDGIRAVLPALGPADVEVVPVPYQDGAVELTFAGERPGGRGEPATSGPVRAALQGSQRATFVLELGRDGAALLWHLLEAGRAPFHARYELTFAHRLDGVSLRVWCDGRRAHDVAARLGAGADRLARTLVEERIAGVELETREVVSPEYRGALDALGYQLLSGALARSLRSPYSPDTEAHVNLTFSASTLVPQRTVHEDVVRLGRTLAELGDRARTVDLGRGFAVALEVAVLCTVDFARDLVDSVHLTVTYDGVAAEGPVHRSAEYLFADGVGPQRFRTDLAGPDQRDVRWRAEVRYRGDPEPVVLEHPPARTTVIVVDLDGTGVLRVHAAVRAPRWADVHAATLELEHPSTGHTGRLVLDAGHPDGTWTAVVRTTPGSLRYRVTWHSRAGTDAAGDWVETTSPTIQLDEPTAARPAGVDLVATGSFDALAQVLVELRSGPDAPPWSAGFTAAGQTATWAAPDLDAADLRYQSRQVLVHRDGHRDELAWVDRDAPVLVVGDLLRFDVLVEPRLLDLGGALRLALLELAPGPPREEASGADPGGDPADRAGETLVLRDRATPTRWSFRMSAPGASEYRYRLTLVPAGGERRVGPWRSSRSGVLVLRPPPDP